MRANVARPRRRALNRVLPLLIGLSQIRCSVGRHNPLSVKRENRLRLLAISPCPQEAPDSVSGEPEEASRVQQFIPVCWRKSVIEATFERGVAHRLLIAQHSTRKPSPNERYRLRPAFTDKTGCAHHLLRHRRPATPPSSSGHGPESPAMPRHGPCAKDVDRF